MATSASTFLYSSLSKVPPLVESQKSDGTQFRTLSQSRRVEVECFNVGQVIEVMATKARTLVVPTRMFASKNQFLKNWKEKTFGKELKQFLEPISRAKRKEEYFRH